MILLGMGAPKTMVKQFASLLFTLLLLVGPITARASEGTTKKILTKPPTENKVVVQLYFVDEDKALPTTKNRFLANRVHLIMAPDLGGQIFSLTNYDGKFPIPREYLRTGSVLAGSYLGARDIKKHFRLTKEGKWVPTRERETYYLYVDDETPYLKTISYWQPTMAWP